MARMLATLSKLLRGAALAMLLALSAPSGAQAADGSYPSRPVRLLIPFSPGGALDIIGRPLAERLSQALGQQFIVDNRGGAGGALGAEMVAKGPADGYTILISGPGPLLVQPKLRKMPYDLQRDFVPVARLSEMMAGMGVSPALGVRTLTEFTALAKAQPGKLSFASSGYGTLVHLQGEMLKLQAGIDLVHVPYKGNAEALPDVMSGTVSALFESVVLPQAKAGKLVLLAMLDDERHPDFPDVPTIKQAGFPDFDIRVWIGAYAPAATPPPIVETLHREMAKLAGDEALRAAIMPAGMRLYARAETRDEMGERLARESAMYAGLIKQANLQME